jgi:hypothetical protein
MAFQPVSSDSELFWCPSRLAAMIAALSTCGASGNKIRTLSLVLKPFCLLRAVQRPLYDFFALLLISAPAPSG